MNKRLNARGMGARLAPTQAGVPPPNSTGPLPAPLSSAACTGLVSECVRITRPSCSCSTGRSPAARVGLSSWRSDAPRTTRGRGAPGTERPHDHRRLGVVDAHVLGRDDEGTADAVAQLSERRHSAPACRDVGGLAELGHVARVHLDRQRPVGKRALQGDAYQAFGSTLDSVVRKRRSQRLCRMECGSAIDGTPIYVAIATRPTVDETSAHVGAAASSCRQAKRATLATQVSARGAR